MTKLTDKKKVDEILKDHETMHMLNQAWVLRQEERWLTQKARDCEFDAKEDESQIQAKHGLDFIDFLYLGRMEEYLFDEKMKAMWKKGELK